MKSLLRTVLVSASCAWIGWSADVQYPPLKLGSAAVDFALPGVDGRTYGLKDFAGSKVLVLVFTCNHCPTAQAYEERLKELVKDYAGRGVAIVAISPNSPQGVRLDELGYTDVGDDFEDMKIRAQERDFNFPYLYDGDSEVISKRYGPAATPHVFIFDAERKLRYQGRIDDTERADLVKVRDTRNAIEALLAGAEPPVKETKVFGCSTKWSDKSDTVQKWMEKVRREPATVTQAKAADLKKLREDTGGKLRLINVWATWCGPCVAEFDELIETNLRFRHRDFELVTVAAQYPDEQAQVLKFLQKHSASTRNLLFGTNDKYALLEALDPDWSGALPHTLLVAPNGKVIHRQTGALDFLELRRQIVPALNAITPWPGMK
ncbi:MAG TPA: redoxin domain-containing protein [Verrucomicrobiota bacterium]|nr:redoxin [Verrucomicrobiales bacterium]HRI16522.1 redoxin domain-containing protein [Verrucomicrobiota bacterium]